MGGASINDGHGRTGGSEVSVAQTRSSALLSPAARHQISSPPPPPPLNLVATCPEGGGGVYPGASMPRYCGITCSPPPLHFNFPGWSARIGGGGGGILFAGEGGKNNDSSVSTRNCVWPIRSCIILRTVPGLVKESKQAASPGARAAELLVAAAGGGGSLVFHLFCP